MTTLVPLSITARNREQAEYLVRSRAEQRGLVLGEVDVSPAGGTVWLVTVAVDDADAMKVQAAQLEEDTQVFIFRSPGGRDRPTAS